MNAEHFEADNETYHRLSGWSNSRLSDFIDDPALAHGRYIADPPLFPRVATTPAMEFGTNCHSVIQAGSLDAVFSIIPRDVLNADGHCRGKAWSEFKAANAGKALVKEEDLAPYRHILNNVKAHDKAAKILYDDDGHNEFNIRWTDDETGIDLRVRIDRAKPGVLNADIKTTETVDPRRFSQAVFSWGYHRQAWLYRQGWMELTGDVLPFVFVAVRKSPPYSVACYELDEAYIELGGQEVRAALADLAERYQSGVWTREAEVIVIEAPGYAKFNDQWSVT